MDTDENWMIETLGCFWSLWILIFPVVINVPDGTFRENRDGTDESLSGLLTSQRSQGTVDQSLRDEDLTSGLWVTLQLLRPPWNLRAVLS